MDSFEAFEGQSAHIAQLRSDFANHTFSHAYMFCGPRGTGKKSVARLCAMAAMCRAEGTRPCGVCGPCRRVLSDTHPDLHTIVPESKDKKTIGVQFFRDTALTDVSVKAFEGGIKVFIVPDAKQMLAPVQNALLKTLEEPPKDTVFILISEQSDTLLPTIRSRCRTIRFHPLSIPACEARLMALGQSASEAKRRARMAEGSVGQALEITEEQLQGVEQLTRDLFAVHRRSDVLPVVNRYKDDKARAPKVLDQMEGVVRHIVLAQSGASSIEGAGYAEEAERYAKTVPLSGGLALAESVAQARIMADSNVSFALVFERVLLDIAEEYKKWPW